ncbi:FAD binding domain-containing protein [Metarhizium brunneum]
MNRLLNRFFAAPSKQSPHQMPFDSEVDVLIIGSGAAGLTASLRAHFHGLEPLVVEKNGKIGGSSAYSGGALWIPQSPLAKEHGIRDSKADALAYMETLIGHVGPASTRQRKLAYLEQAPFMVDFLRHQGFNCRLSKGCPDYYPKTPGAFAKFGRTIEPGIFDLNKLNQWQTLVHTRPLQPPPCFTDEFASLTKMGSSASDFAQALKLQCRILWRKAVGEEPATMGLSLVAQLLHLNQQRNLAIRRNTALVDMIQQQDGAVVGATVQQNGRIQSIRARRGVLLCAGGFAHNRAMREECGPAPASTAWTSTPEGDTGDAIRAGVRLGAATALMDGAWWGPTIVDPVAGKNFFALQERSRPFSIIVDSSGSRFMNESAEYTACGREQYARNRDVKAIPAWLALDANHRKRYSLGCLMPRQEPEAGLRKGYIYKAETLGALAAKIGVDPAGLRATVSRFNTMAREGVDRDFGRGSDAYDNYFGDGKVGPNPNLGPVAVAPFYAVAVVPGDLGTNGGLITDEHARVLRADGSVIKGLYAAGNTSASVMGRSYPGAGSTLGPALTFGYIAVNHMASVSTE